MTKLNSKPIVGALNKELAGNRLRLAINSAQLKFFTMAVDLEVQPRTIHNWCNGSGINIRKLKMCSDYLGLDIRYFLMEPESFPESEFIKEVERKIFSPKSRGRNQEREFYFSGDDSFAISLFLKLFKKHIALNNIRVFVEGSLKETIETRLEGKVVSTILDSYIRNFTIKTDLGEIYTVGGSNASSEDIAAKNVIFSIESELIPILVDTPFLIYSSQEKFPIEMIDTQISIGYYSSAISMLKRNKNTSSLLILEEMIGNNIPKECSNLLYDSFRSFSELYDKKSDFSLSLSVSEKLIIDLDYLLLENDINSAIYCMESLGYSVNNEKSLNILTSFIIEQLKNGLNKYHLHFIWSSYQALFSASTKVAATKEIKSNINVLLEELSEMISV